MTATLTAPEATQSPASPTFDVSAWLCDWCNHTRDPENDRPCACLPVTGQLRREVNARHRDAVRRAGGRLR